MTDVFLQQAEERKKIRMTFFDQRGKEKTKLFSPLGYGPVASNSSAEKVYHLWDDEEQRRVSFSMDEIVTMVFTNMDFDPSELRFSES
jgi:hypothetical protein